MILIVKHGDAWAVLEMDECFTFDLLERFVFGSFVTLTLPVVENSRINVWLDNSNQQISLTIQEATFFAFEKAMAEIFPAYNKSASLAASPVRMMEPVYGEKNPSFTYFIAPRFAV